jgi:hypothetical protein
MEIYIRKKWQRRAFEEPEEEVASTIECPTPEIPSASSTTSSLVSSPTIQLAGQVFPTMSSANNSNPFLVTTIDQQQQPQQRPYSPSFSHVNPFNNPFQNQDKRMSMNPFYSTNNNHSRSNSYNPFIF